MVGPAPTPEVAELARVSWTGKKTLPPHLPPSLLLSVLALPGIQICLDLVQEIAPDEWKAGGPPATLSRRGFQEKQIVNRDLNIQHMDSTVELQALWEPYFSNILTFVYFKT